MTFLNTLTSGRTGTVLRYVAVALAGIQQLLLCCIAYIPGIFFYKKAQREREMLQ